MGARRIGIVLIVLVTVGGVGVDAAPTAASGPPASVAIAEAFPLQTGPGAVPPDEFPTIAGLDFTAFPRRLSLPPAPAPGGRTIHVAEGATDGDGSEAQPFGSPVRGVRAAEAGDVVLVGDGRYEMYDRRCGCGLALWTDDVTIAAEHPGAVVLVPGRDAVDGFTIRGQGVAVVGLRLRGFRDAIFLGEETNPVQDVVLQGLVLRGGGILMGLAESEHPSTPPVAGVLIADTRIRGSAKRAIIGINCAQGPCEDVRISGVTVTLVPSGSGDSGMDAIGIESGSNVLVEATEVTGADADGIDIKASKTAVVNCSVHGVGRNGVKMWRGGDVVNTLVVDTGADAAVVFEMPARYRILHSLVIRHSPTVEAYTATVSYDYPGTGTLEVVNSIFYDNSGALWISPDYDVNVSNSIFYRSLTDGLLVWGDVEIYEGDGFAALEAAGGGSANREVDPLFVDPSADDFHLDAGSPGLGFGTTAVDAYVGFDFDGQPRGAEPPDLGPYEEA